MDVIALGLQEVTQEQFGALFDKISAACDGEENAAVVMVLMAFVNMLFEELPDEQRQDMVEYFTGFLLEQVHGKPN